MARPTAGTATGSPSETTSVGLTAPTSPELTERRYIYNGEPPASRLPGTTAAAAAEAGEYVQQQQQHGNRPVSRRRRSPLTLIAGILVVSLLIVLYIWNKIAVNQLVIDVNDLQSQYQKTLSTNDVLRADINRKSSLERINTLATGLGLTYPKEQPVWFDVDRNDLDRFEVTTR